MTTVTLRLFFYGLVAFTPDEFQCDGNMRALLIDACRPPVASDGCPIHPHTPALFYFVTHPDACRYPCRNDRGLCRCDLQGGHLLDIGRDERDPLCFERPDCPLPTGGTLGSCSDGGFDFVPKLQPLRPIGSRMNLHPACNNHCPVRSSYCQGGMCKLVAAQINFHPRGFSICRMAGQPDDGSPVCPAFEFRPLASRNLWWQRDRQIAEIVLFEAEIKVRNPHKVELTIASFEDGGTDKIFVPVYEYDEKYYADLVIANFMNEVDHDRAYARCDQNFVARDFELYHDLVRQPMYPADRTIPRAEESAPLKSFPPRIYNSGQDNYSCYSNALTIFRSSILRAGDSRPICPQAAVGQ